MAGAFAARAPDPKPKTSAQAIARQDLTERVSAVTRRTTDLVPVLHEYGV